MSDPETEHLIAPRTRPDKIGFRKPRPRCSYVSPFAKRCRAEAAIELRPWKDKPELARYACCDHEAQVWWQLPGVDASVRLCLTCEPRVAL